MRKIKLIWDFRARDVEHFAKHHAKHLEEYILNENYEYNLTGFEIKNEFHATAYLIVNESDMNKFTEILKPHRAIYFEE